MFTLGYFLCGAHCIARGRSAVRERDPGAGAARAGDDSVVLIFALVGAAMVLETGDPASAAGAVIMVVLAGVLIHARRQLMNGRSRRAVMLLVASVLAAVLASAPPVPALAAAPIMAVAFALSFLAAVRLPILTTSRTSAECRGP